MVWQYRITLLDRPLPTHEWLMLDAEEIDELSQFFLNASYFLFLNFFFNSYIFMYYVQMRYYVLIYFCVLCGVFGVKILNRVDIINLGDWRKS